MKLVVYRNVAFNQVLDISDLGVTPQMLAGARLFMDIKKNPKDKKPIARLSSDNGGLFVEPNLMLLAIAMTPEDTTLNTKSCNYAYYDVVALTLSETGPVPIRLFGGKVAYRETTTDIPSLMVSDNAQTLQP